MSRKWMAAAALLVLMLLVCVFALAEEPTDPVYPEPGPLEKHEHTISIKIVDRGYTAHRLNEWCPDCGRLLKERLEGHNFVDGVCTVCDWECPHPPEAAEKHYERDGVKPQWDGNYIIGPGWEITECSICHKVLSRVETTVREFHNVHTHFTPVLECLPHDADTHALIRYCDECGTEVPEYVPHNCPPSDRPYTDEGDPDTHSRLVMCADCGFWVPQQQPHTWVHDSYTEFDGSGDYHNEVMRCSVCGAVKQVLRKHEWKRTACLSDGDEKTHTSSYECTVCGDCKEVSEPHELAHFAYKNDGDTESHIDVFVCTECDAEIEKRAAHKPMHISWECVSDTHDREIVRCNMCGLTYSLEPVSHTFTAKKYKQSSMFYHKAYPECSKCGAQQRDGDCTVEVHYFGDYDGLTCLYCNYVKFYSGHEHTCEEKHVAVCALDAELHTLYYHCDDPFCWILISRGTEPHTFDPITMRCTVCGYLKEGCKHQYTYEPFTSKSTEAQHMLIGTCTGCGKQIMLEEAHDMHFFSATEYISYGNGHTRVVTERCSVCGYEKQHAEAGNHDFSTGESIGEQEHKPICSLCGSYGDPEPHTFVCASDESVHECSICGEKGEHDYFLNGYRRYDENYHACVYQCRMCTHQKEEKQEHILKSSAYIIHDRETHGKYTVCTLCSFGYEEKGRHNIMSTPSNPCVCGYYRGYPVREAPEGLTEDSGDGTAVMPVFCHLAADGNEIPFGYGLTLSDEGTLENGDALRFTILPESISGDSVIEARFTASEIGLLQTLGVKDVYIRLSDTDFPLLSDIGQVLTVLSGQERDELVITLIPGSDGAYTVQYDPASVYITE